MVFDKEPVRSQLLSWEALLQGFSLPGWEDFPALPLYMDQVIYLMNGYLALIPPEEKEEVILTPAMINNYVKLKIIPAPVKKRYGRVHLAYLVMVCVLKQIMTTSGIRQLIPSTLTEDAVRALYADFIQTVQTRKAEFCAAVREDAQAVLSPDGPPVTHLVFQAAITANLYKLLTRQLYELQPQETAARSGA